VACSLESISDIGFVEGCIAAESSGGLTLFSAATDGSSSYIAKASKSRIGCPGCGSFASLEGLDGDGERDPGELTSSPGRLGTGAVCITCLTAAVNVSTALPVVMRKGWTALPLFLLDCDCGGHVDVEPRISS